MKKMMSTTMTLAVFAGIGIATYMMYKKKNPNMINDMKKTIQNMATDVAYKLDDMEM